MRAAASSMASGMPSRRRQISSTSSREAAGSNVGRDCPGTLVEQLGSRSGRVQGSDGDELFFADPEGFSRRGEHPHRRAILGDGLGQVGRAVDDVFAVVQHEKRRARLQRRNDRWVRVRPALSLTSRTSATARGTSLEDVMLASSISHAPSARSASASSAAARASRVLPMPPAQPT